MTTETRSVEYYGQQLQRCAMELQGLGYTLAHHGAEARNAGCSGTAIEFHNTAGTVARLRSQLDHLLSKAQTLLYACEDVAPQDRR